MLATQSALTKDSPPNFALEINPELPLQSELPAQLGIDLAHCQQQAENAIHNSHGSLQIFQGEIMSTKYFDGIAAEIDESLQETGMVSLVDLARRFKLGSDLMQSTILSHLGKEIKGQFEAGILTTDVYHARIKAQVKLFLIYLEFSHSHHENIGPSISRTKDQVCSPICNLIFSLVLFSAMKLERY